MKQNEYDPTVVDEFQKNLIERSTGTRLTDASPEELAFITSQSKEAGNKLFKEKKYRGTRMLAVVSWVY